MSPALKKGQLEVDGFIWCLGKCGPGSLFQMQNPRPLPQMHEISARILARSAGDLGTRGSWKHQSSAVVLDLRSPLAYLFSFDESWYPGCTPDPLGQTLWRWETGVRRWHPSPDDSSVWSRLRITHHIREKLANSPLGKSFEVKLPEDKKIKYPNNAKKKKSV